MTTMFVVHVSGIDEDILMFRDEKRAIDFANHARRILTWATVTVTSEEFYDED